MASSLAGGIAETKTFGTAYTSGYVSQDLVISVPGQHQKLHPYKHSAQKLSWCGRVNQQPKFISRRGIDLRHDVVGREWLQVMADTP
jgi:hypothetical protein